MLAGCGSGSREVGWYHGDDKVSEIQRGVVKVDEDVVVTEGWDVSFFVEFEAVKAGFALNGPLLGG